MLRVSVQSAVCDMLALYMRIPLGTLCSNVYMVIVEICACRMCMVTGSTWENLRLLRVAFLETKYHASVLRMFENVVAKLPMCGSVCGKSLRRIGCGGVSGIPCSSGHVTERMVR